MRVAREVAAGRIDLERCEHELAWRRLLAVPTVGRWTVEMLAAHGQGRYDVLPAGDLGYLKLLGRWRSGGDPAARAEEAEVRALFERFGAWRGLAAKHALGMPRRRASSSPRERRPREPAGRRAGRRAASGAAWTALRPRARR